MKSRKILTLLTALILSLTFLPTAHADILWEPYDNSFYMLHQNECTYLNRAFYANGPDGYVEVLDRPNGKNVQITLENTESAYVTWLYGDWGCLARWIDGKEYAGWVPMSQMILVYDYICFQEDYADQIQPYQGEFDFSNTSASGIAVYEYPGAPQTKGFFPLSNLGADSISNFSNYIKSTFLDENGLAWGYLEYLQGYRNIWFCMDDVTGGIKNLEEYMDSDGQAEAGHFPIRDVPVPEFIPPQAPPSYYMRYLPHILVGTVVLVTAIILFFFYRKKSDKPESDSM